MFCQCSFLGVLWCHILSLSGSLYSLRMCSKFIYFHVAVQLFPALFGEEIVLFPLYIFASFIEDKVSIGSWIYLWAFYSVPLIYICLCLAPF